MTTFSVKITIHNQNHDVLVDSFGEGSIPIIICGHAEIYANLLKKAFARGGLLDKYRFFVPRTYWCEGAPLVGVSDLNLLTLKDLAQHIEQVREGLAAQGVLQATADKVGIYCHSFFSAMAFHYAAQFPDKVLFIEAEAPPPYNTEQWAKEKSLFFKGNADLNRKQALAKEGIDPGSSAVDEKSLEKFPLYCENYHRMNPTLWWNYKNDYRITVWGDKALNMVLMQRYLVLLRNYDSRDITDKVNCPVHFTLGIIDTPVPPYLWIDSKDKGGVGFFDHKNKKRDYHVHTESGHWPYTEQPMDSCHRFNKFVDEFVLPQLEMKPEAPSKPTLPQLRAKF